MAHYFCPQPSSPHLQVFPEALFMQVSCTIGLALASAAQFWFHFQQGDGVGGRCGDFEWIDSLPVNNNNNKQNSRRMNGLHVCLVNWMKAILQHSQSWLEAAQKHIISCANAPVAHKQPTAKPAFFMPPQGARHESNNIKDGGQLKLLYNSGLRQHCSYLLIYSNWVRVCVFVFGWVCIILCEKECK